MMSFFQFFIVITPVVDPSNQRSKQRLSILYCYYFGCITSGETPVIVILSILYCYYHQPLRNPGNSIVFLTFNSLLLLLVPLQLFCLMHV